MSIRKTDVHLRYKIPTEITVIVDTREKIPILFPSIINISHPEFIYRKIPIAVKVERRKLDYGDYALDGYADICVFERKSSQFEIFKNLNESHDRIRQAKAFRRMKSSCKFPYVLIEASPAELLKSDPKIKHPELICHRLGLALAKYGLQALFIPWKSRNANTRRKVGTLMLHIMVACILEETYDALPSTLLKG